MVVTHTASGGATEADIRIIAATFTGFVVFAAVSAQAAPVLRTAGEPGGCPPIEKLAQERGSGLHSIPCDERWGHCHSDSCFPMGTDNPYRPRREANWLD
jgi:hypothetical protein